MTDIGKPKRIIEVEPEKQPAPPPQREPAQPVPSKQPERRPEPARR